MIKSFQLTSPIIFVGLCLLSACTPKMYGSIAAHEFSFETPGEAYVRHFPWLDYMIIEDNELEYQIFFSWDVRKRAIHDILAEQKSYLETDGVHQYIQFDQEVATTFAGYNGYTVEYSFTDKTLFPYMGRIVIFNTGGTTYTLRLDIFDSDFAASLMALEALEQSFKITP